MSRLVLFLHSPGYEHAYQAASLAVTAAAMGREVWVVPAFGALEQLAHGVFGAPHPAADRAAADRATRLSVPTPAELLAEARVLGAKVVVCETVARLSGLTAEEARACADDVLGLASIVKALEGAQALYL